MIQPSKVNKFIEQCGFGYMLGRVIYNLYTAQNCLGKDTFYFQALKDARNILNGIIKEERKNQKKESN